MVRVDDPVVIAEPRRRHEVGDRLVALAAVVAAAVVLVVAALADGRPDVVELLALVGRKAQLGGELPAAGCGARRRGEAGSWSASGDGFAVGSGTSAQREPITRPAAKDRMKPRMTTSLAMGNGFVMRC